MLSGLDLRDHKSAPPDVGACAGLVVLLEDFAAIIGVGIAGVL